LTSLYSDVEWNVDINDNGQARHRLKIKLFNVSSRIPTVQDYLEIIFPEDKPIKNFETKINTEPLASGYGYTPGANAYRLRFDDIPVEKRNQSLLNIEIYFEQENAVSKMFDVKLVDIGFQERLHASSIVLTFKLPMARGLKRLFYLFVSKLKRRKTIYEIALSPGSRKSPDYIEPNNGLISYKSRRIESNFGFIYRSGGQIDIASLVLGLISGIVTGLIVKLIVDWLYNVLH
jgi:hypothetical protein